MVPLNPVGENWNCLGVLKNKSLVPTQPHGFRTSHDEGLGIPELVLVSD